MLKPRDLVSTFECRLTHVGPIYFRFAPIDSVILVAYFGPEPCTGLNFSARPGPFTHRPGPARLQNCASWPGPVRLNISQARPGPPPPGQARSGPARPVYVPSYT